MMTLFEALYGYPPPLPLPYFTGDSKNVAVDLMLQEKESMDKLLQGMIKEAQHRMKQIADRK